MGVSSKVAQSLNNIGHEAIHLNDEGLHQLEDHKIIEKAIDESRIILTADVDFGQILAFAKSSSISVIQFRILDITP